MNPFNAAHLLTLLKTKRTEALFGTKEQRSQWQKEQNAYWEALQREAVKLQRKREMYPTEEEFEHDYKQANEVLNEIRGTEEDQ